MPRTSQGIEKISEYKFRYSLIFCEKIGGNVFFEPCKIILKKHEDYKLFINHYTDVLHGPSSSIEIKEYPVYVFLDESMRTEHTYHRHEYDRRKCKRTSLASFLEIEYAVTRHFRKRFDERYGKVSDSRFRRLTNTMLERGTWLKRKDSSKTIKYHKISDYVAYNHYEGADKVYYLLVLTDENILTTIYQFDVKDLKHFREK